MAMGFIKRDEIRAKLDELGVEKVQLMMSSGEFSITWNPAIFEWLGEKDKEEQRKKNAYNRWILWVAIAAMIVGVVAILVTFAH